MFFTNKIIITLSKTLMNKKNENWIKIVNLYLDDITNLKMIKGDILRIQNGEKLKIILESDLL